MPEMMSKRIAEGVGVPEIVFEVCKFQRFAVSAKI